MVCDCCPQLCAVLRKNWLLKRRRWCSTLLEILLPVIIMLFMVLIRNAISREVQPSTTYTPQGWYWPSEAEGMLAFVGDETLPLEAAFKANFPTIFNQTLRFSSNDALDDYCKLKTYGAVAEYPQVWAAIVLNKGAPQWDYTIRMNSSIGDRAAIPSTALPNVDKLQKGANFETFYQYLGKGWTPLQLFVDSWIFNQANATLAPLPFANNTGNNNYFIPSDGFDYGFTSFPTVAYERDSFADVASGLLGFFIVIAFIWPFTRLVRNFVFEKEKKIKEGMKMMGLKDAVWWMSWCITYLIMFIIMCILIVLVSGSSVYKYSDKGLIFLYFFVFSLSIFAMAALFNTFFSKARSSATVGAVLFLGSYFPYFAVFQNTNYSGKTGCCILSTTCFGLGADVIAKLESSGQGANYGTWTVTVNDFDLNTCIGMMWLDTLIYLLFAWYLDKVLPSEFGSPYPPWFIFMSSFWCPKKSRLIAGEKYGGDGGLPLSTMKSEGKEYVGTVEEGEGREKKEGEDRSGYFEAVGAEVKRNGGVAIKDIQKEFNVDGQLVRAVRGINLELFEGQITALLGHNGAGKSTLISMLTGLIPPTDGDAEFYGMSLREDLQSIRTSMGVCPQHDVLFDELTVVEHLQLFGRLKGMTGDLSGPINEIIADVGLTEKKDAFSSTLSGGQKRKLSIAIALIGGSKVVFLDECTSGMDVYSRRWIWNMLLKKKEGRVIILTTHFMDEADQLGDRIAIMAKGKLQCCGSSLFLKNLYGVGYTMTISKTETAETARIQELVKSHVPTSEQLGLAGGEISFRLPFKASSSFPDMFTDFDRRIGGDSESLGIRSYGIAVTTLEEVFLRVGKEETVTVADKRAASERIRSYSDRRISISKEKKELTETLLVEKPEGEKKKDKFDELLALKCEHENVFWTHFRALFIKRMRNAYRDRKQWIMQVFVPILITFAGLAALKWAPQASDSLKVLSTSQFNTPNYIPYTQAQGLPFNTSSLFDNTLPSEGVPVLALSNTTVSDDEFNTYLLNSIPDQTQIRYLGYNINPPFNPSTTAQANLYVNTSAIHAIPIAMNLLHSNYLRELTGDPTADITVSSFPLPLTASLSSVSGLTGALIIGIGFAFIPSSWVAFAVKERETNAKHQQLISGVSIYSYWFSTMTWDCVNYTIPAILALILIAGFNIEALVGSNAGATILAIILYAPSIAAYTYLWSFAFKSHSTAQNTMVLIYILTGVLLALVSFFLSVIPSTRTANLKLKFLYRLLPNFCFGECLINLITKDILFVWGKPQTTWSMEIMGFPCLFMMWETFFYLLCVFAIEKVLSTPYLLKYFYRNPRVTDPPHEDDEDVAAEKKRMQSPSDDIVQVKGLRKEYGSLLGSVGKVAVKDLWFGIPKGECFGFLGINGAGKTTSLQMLTGAEYPTAGSAVLNGFDIFTQQEELRRHLGYCPQFDALIETLTATETLTLYARIKGVPEARVAEYVDAIIEKVALREYANRPCGGYSGGNKRKLSVGVAMIGNPSIIILDEPSTGMDPAAKRFMWDLISSTSTNRSLILTTHSLEESEALCHRIGIMVSGRLRCLGSAQHLRSRFGKGYQIEFKIEDSKTSITNAQKWIEETFTNPQLVEIHGDHLKYKIARDLSLGKVFSEIERNKEKYRILEYSCSEYSLEQIFIHFAKQQEEEQATVGGVVGSGERGHETELVTFKDAKTPQSPDEEV